MEVRDFREGWIVEITGHRLPKNNGAIGVIRQIKKYTVLVVFEYTDGTFDICECMPHELIVRDKNGW